MFAILFLGKSIWFLEKTASHRLLLAQNYLTTMIKKSRNISTQKMWNWSWPTTFAIWISRFYLLWVVLIFNTDMLCIWLLLLYVVLLISVMNPSNTDNIRSPSWGLYCKIPYTERIKTTEIHAIAVLEAASLKPGW